MTDKPFDATPPKPLHRYLVLGVTSLAVGLLSWWNFCDTYHLVVVDPGKVYRDGNRSVREFKSALRNSHARTVIAVIDQQEYDQKEFVEARKLARGRGIEWIWIPVKAGRFPRPDQVQQFLKIASNPSKQPVLYHDDEGIRRAGMMMAAYQEAVLGYTDEQAKAAIKPFGHSDQETGDVGRFIDDFDPLAGLTVDLNVKYPPGQK